VFSLLDRADNSIDLSHPNIEGETLLHMASRAGDKALISYLLDKSVDVNAVYVDKVLLVLLRRITSPFTAYYLCIVYIIV